MGRPPKQVADADSQIDEILKSVASRLTERRKHLGLTQTQLGEKVGVKQSYIFELEQGQANITVKTLARMARALELDLRDLLPGGAMSPPSHNDIQQLVSMLGRLAEVVEGWTNQDRQRAEQQRTFLEEIRSLTGLRESLAPVRVASEGASSSVVSKKPS